MLSDAEALRSSLVEIREKTWVKCEEMGAVVVWRASVAAQYVHAPAPFTQESGRFCGCDQMYAKY